MRKILKDKSIGYNTDIRQSRQWPDQSFELLATDNQLPFYFKQAGHPIPYPIKPLDLKNCDTVKSICPAVQTAFNPPAVGHA